MSRHGGTAAAVLLVLLAGCGKGSTAPRLTGLKSITVTTAPVRFGALGRTAQFAAVAKDSNGATLSGIAFTWGSSDPTVATVSGSGLATAVANGTTGISAASGSTQSLPVQVTVQQVPGIIVVAATSAGPDTLETTGRTRQYAATVRDSGGAAMSGVAVTWSSSATGVASVSASGLATAVADGSANVTATAGAASGVKALVVRRYASTFSLSPAVDSITAAGGTALLSGAASDSVSTVLPIAWLSRATGLATVSPASGATTTVTAKGNGSVYIVISGGTRSDSSQITISGQPAPAADTVSVGDIFFQSRQNGTQNPAVDTVAVNGTVVWVWSGRLNHSVQSTGSPSFSSSASQASGNYSHQFTVAGTYTYDCVVHGTAMTGTIVVR